MLQNKIWYVVKSDPNGNTQQGQVFKNENDYVELKLNDIIKLGRVKYVITEKKINGNKESIEQNTIGSQVFQLIYDYKYLFLI